MYIKYYFNELILHTFHCIQWFSKQYGGRMNKIKHIINIIIAGTFGKYSCHLFFQNKIYVLCKFVLIIMWNVIAYVSFTQADKIWHVASYSYFTKLISTLSCFTSFVCLYFVCWNSFWSIRMSLSFSTSCFLCVSFTFRQNTTQILVPYSYFSW